MMRYNAAIAVQISRAQPAYGVLMRFT